MQDFAALANHLADEAGKIVEQYFRKPFDVTSKSDASPVTVADQSIEKRLREIIEHHRPNDGILGEEYGLKKGKSGYTWVIDPIDGTKSFVIGRPTFGTLIALCKDGVPIVGVIDQAISKERWVGAQGQATTFNSAPVKTRRCPKLKDACSASTTPAMFRDTKPVYWDVEKNTKMMAWGGDCYMYGLLASGYMDLVVEAALSPYDFAALVPVVQGAGGYIADWSGKPLTLQSDGRVIALGDAALWDQVAPLLQA